MRRAVGLPSPDRRIGLSAHDFQQAMGAPRVIVTRAAPRRRGPDRRLALAPPPRQPPRRPRRRGPGRPRRGQGPRRGLAAARRRLDLPAARIPPAPPPGAAPAGRGPPGGALRHPGRGAGPRPLRDLRPLGPPPAAPRPARPQARRPRARHRDPRRARPLRHRDPRRPARRRRAGLPRRRPRRPRRRSRPGPPSTPSGPRGSNAPPRWFLDSEAERRARGTPAAREVRGRRDVDGLAHPFAVTARADRIDAAGRRLRASTTTSPAPARRAEARAFHLQLPLEAAIAAAGGFEGLPAGPRAHLELLKFGNAGEAPAARPPTRRTTRRDLGPLHRASSPTTRTRPTASPPASARSSSPGRSDYDHLSRKGEWADGDDPEEAW